MKTIYFSHDYNARNDIKIIKLISEMGYEGYGLYWAIIEMLYENANAMPSHYETIAFALRTDTEKIKKVIEKYKLFNVENGYISSSSVERRIMEINNKREMAKKSAMARWRNANAMRTQCERNAINKIKENKIKEYNSITIAQNHLTNRDNSVPEQIDMSKSKIFKKNTKIFGTSGEKEIISFELRDGKAIITESVVKQFAELYKGIDIECELKKMKAWIISNPNKNKKTNGFMRFINMWLSKSVNNINTVGPGTMSPRNALPAGVLNEKTKELLKKKEAGL